jgi:single-stranded DNA-binding protein
MVNSQNYVQLYGILGNDPEEIETVKSNFTTFSLGTSARKSTDWHKVIVFGHEYERYSAFIPKKGDQVRVDGTISYRKREIKDTEGNVIATVKEASIIAIRVLGLVKKKR